MSFVDHIRDPRYAPAPNSPRENDGATQESLITRTPPSGHQEVNAGVVGDATVSATASIGAPILVSACLLGVKCRYDGKSKAHSLPDLQLVLPVCPEIMAGFGVPRPAIERGEDGRVRVLDTGVDVSEPLIAAAESIVALAQSHGVRRAILKEGSPSCGSRELRRGGAIVPGQGVLAERLRAANIVVESEAA